MATYTLAPVPGQTFLSDTGAIVPGGQIWTYVSGTSTPTPTYSTQDGTVQQPNPIVLDGFGRVPSEIYLPPGTTQKWIFQTAAGATIRTYPTVAAVPASASNQDILGVAGVALTAGTVAYLSDGSGSLVAGKWYKTDAALAYASITPLIGIVVADIALNATGTIRLAGSLTVTGPLVTGSAYYVSGTVGTLTTTAPTFARYVGQADTTTSIIIEANPPLPATSNSVADGRLTATTAVPVTTADVTGATSIYYTPYTGNRIALYDGTALWNVRAFTEIAISISAAVASKPYDVFLYDNAGVVTAEILVWTNDTTRATALVKQDGVWVKTGALTRRYVGSFYADSGAGATTDSAAARNLWNYYNRVPRSLIITDNTNSWTYTTATWRQARATATNQVDFLIGYPEDAVSASVTGKIANTNVGVAVAIAIGLDSTTVPSTAGSAAEAQTAVAATRIPLIASYVVYPGVGKHRLVWLENSEATGTTTFYGSGSGFSGTLNGIVGTIWG